MGPRRRLGVVLDGERQQVVVGVGEFQALDDVVVEADVAHPGVAPAGLDGGVERCVHGEPVVLGGDLDLAGAQVLDRLVDPAVAVFQLVGAESEGAAEDLVAEADAEVGDAGVEHLAQQRHGRVGGRRVARSIGEEHPVGAARDDLVQGHVGGQHMHLDAPLGHPGGRHVLDAQIDGGDGEPLLPHRRDHLRVGQRDVGDQILAGHPRGLQDALQQLGRVEFGGGDADPHGAALAQVPGQGAGVDLGDPDHALAAQFVVQGTVGAPIGPHPGEIPHHIPGDPDAGGLVVLVVPAGVADVRRGRDDHLAVIAGVGERLLVAGHAGGEHRLTERLSAGSEGDSAEGSTIFENQQCRDLCAFEEA